MNNVHIVDYDDKVDPESGKRVVTAIAEDGRLFVGDVLIGADGIWSKVRRKLVGDSEAQYSDYTCYTGISDYTPPDIDTGEIKAILSAVADGPMSHLRYIPPHLLESKCAVLFPRCSVGYRVFLGNGQYFVSSDVGGGKTQWYGFHREAAGGTDKDGRRKERLLSIFGSWTDMGETLLPISSALWSPHAMDTLIYSRAAAHGISLFWSSILPRSDRPDQGDARGGRPAT